MAHLFRAFLVLFLTSVFLSVSAQDSLPVTFGLSTERINSNEVVLRLKAKVPPGVKVYAIQRSADEPLFSTLTFDTSFARYLQDTVDEKGKVRTENDAALGATVRYISDSIIWQQRASIPATDSVVLKGLVTLAYKQGESYLSGEQAIRFYVPREERVSASPQGAVEGITGNRSLWWIFATAFAGGLLALLTPCVYSMIPITVSFFTKRSKNRKEGLRNAVYYSTSIIIIFTLLGFLITLIFGPAALNNLATNWIANLVFFILFLVFGISFLGAFDISLPSSWSTKVDTKAGMGSFAGIFFMALTLVLVSFSCTGPIIGNLLVLAAKGSYYGPLVGMFGFSLALAMPFALFAFFPSKLNILGRAGGWLNAVKVTLGFLELALALKFLSNADLAKGWRILDREIFIALWIVIFGLLGMYLLGKIRFSHDDELPKNDYGLQHLSVTRLFFAMAALFFAVYLVPGMWGAPLKGISAFVPPMGTQDFTGAAAISRGGGAHSDATAETGGLPAPVKYYDRMKIYEPEVVTKYGMITYFDYDEALAVARKVKKPLMLDFTGINCVNCRKMEGQVWSDPRVMQRLKENFVIVSLYVDVQEIDLQTAEVYFSKALNKQVETLGDKHADFQVTRFGANTQPYYFFLDSKENRLAPEGYGYDANIDQFIKLLDGVSAAYNKSDS
ncbi:thioredoxin family protein [Segetibacter sp. 3557_3]|uniref:protein-disulfide reductase DsbD family protein n=1 Tax=Segetibacter sp. 3557_3 TaxID=2547429 RepID=UPI001058B71A|nr:thioredoxin family protein [Segetibacter sp. 3557_3]TDH27049.1 thioredoxin family protein [Segetibacter sp. 3557_3]